MNLVLIVSLVLAQSSQGAALGERDARRDDQEYAWLRSRFTHALHEIVEMSASDDASKKLLEEATHAETIARFMKLSRGRPRDPEAVDALVWISRFSPWPPTRPATSDAEEARRMLASQHLGSERLALAFAGAMVLASGSEGAEMLYREALSQSPHRAVRGRACYWLGCYLLEQADWGRELSRPDADWKDVPEARRVPLIVARRWGEDALKRLKGKDPNQLTKEAESLFERASSQFDDVTTRGDGSDRIGEAARVQLHAIRDLAVGRTAPQIEGQDVDGKVFRLSDFRGKIVVLTFSGNWCGPCRAMYPHERALVERMKGEHFALLSVNTDEKKETLQDAIKRGEVTWRCWWDRSTTGPICDTWHIVSFPTVFVIDREGTIRFKNVRGQELDAALAELLARTRHHNNR